MRLVFLLSLNKKFGGGDYSIFKFAEALAAQGHKIDLFYLGNLKLLGHVKNADFNVHKKFNLDLKFKGSGQLNNFIGYFYDQLFLNKFLKKEGRSVDYIAGYQTDTALKAFNLGKKFNIKTVTFTFETPDWLMEKWPKWKLAYFSNSKLRNIWEGYKNTLLYSNIIVANSKLTAHETKKWIGKEPDLVLYPGVAPNELETKEIKKERQIIYVGRLEDNKNINEIIEALALIKTDIQLVICGRGSIEKELHDLAKTKNVNVDFKGQVSDEEKWTEIKRSLFMVFPTSFEGFGIPPMEALLMGIPCVCTNIPILNEVYGNNIEYFEEHNVIELSKIIEMMLNKTDYVKERGEKGREFVKKNFGWNKSAEKLELKLEEYLKSSNS